MNKELMLRLKNVLNKIALEGANEYLQEYYNVLTELIDLEFNYKSEVNSILIRLVSCINNARNNNRLFNEDEMKILAIDANWLLMNHMLFKFDNIINVDYI